MTDTFKSALDAALQFHANHTAGASQGDVLDTAKTFYRELAVAAPGAAEDWDESWFSRVGTWLAALSGDQLGSVKGQLANLERGRIPNSVPQGPGCAHYQSAPPIPMPGVAPIPTEPGAIPPAWALFDDAHTQDKPPTLVPGDYIRIRPKGADPYTSNTYAALVQHTTEGFLATFPPDTFSEEAADQIPADSTSAVKLVEILTEALPNSRTPVSGGLLQLAKEVGSLLQRRTKRVKELEDSQERRDTALREALGAEDEHEDDDSYRSHESALEAVKRVMGELKASEARVQELVWQLDEEQVRGKVREFGFGTESKPPATVTVLRLICAPAQREIAGGYLMRCGEGWVRVQRRPEYPMAPVGKDWNNSLPSAESRARELTRAEMQAWEAGR